MKPEQIIAMACDQAGCDEDERKVHFHQYLRKGWNPHPPAAFVAWWLPYETDPDSGASVGGQPDAMRVHARKDPGGWARSRFGMDTTVAWNSAPHRAQFFAWQEAGSPQPDEPYVSLALPLAEQRARWARLEAMVDLALPEDAP